MPDPQRRTTLETDLRALGRELAIQIGDIDLSRAVVDQLARHRAPSTPRGTRRRVAVVVAVAVVALALAASAAVAIRAFFDIGAVRVHESVRPLGPTLDTRPLELGTRTTLDAVRDRARVVVPAEAGFTDPDEVWFDPDAGGVVSLVYAARTGDVALLVQEVTGDGSQTFSKHLGAGTQALELTVDGEQGVLLTGGDHSLYYVDGSGIERSETGRLVGRALVFQHGAQTIRLEGALSRDRLLAIAESMR